MTALALAGMGATVDVQRHPHLAAFGSDGGDGSDFDSGDPDTIARVNGCGRGEVSGHRFHAKVRGVHQHHAGREGQRDERTCQRGVWAGNHGGPHRSCCCGIPLRGNGNSARGARIVGWLPGAGSSAESEGIVQKGCNS